MEAVLFEQKTVSYCVCNANLHLFFHNRNMLHVKKLHVTFFACYMSIRCVATQNKENEIKRCRVVKSDDLSRWKE